MDYDVTFPLTKTTCTAAYAAVVAIISLFFAFVKMASAREQSPENPTMVPRRAPCDLMKYRTTIDKTGKIDENMIVSIRTRLWARLSDVKFKIPLVC